MNNLSTTKTECGYAAVADVETQRLEDRMDSFFLSETCKYLYLLFDAENEFANNPNIIFTTEGHILPVFGKSLEKRMEEDDDWEQYEELDYADARCEVPPGIKPKLFSWAAFFSQSNDSIFLDALGEESEKYESLENNEAVNDLNNFIEQYNVKQILTLSFWGKPMTVFLTNNPPNKPLILRVQLRILKKESEEEDQLKEVNEKDIDESEDKLIKEVYDKEHLLKMSKGELRSIAKTWDKVLKNKFKQKQDTMGAKNKMHRAYALSKALDTHILKSKEAMIDFITQTQISWLADKVQRELQQTQQQQHEEEETSSKRRDEEQRKEDEDNEDTPFEFEAVLASFGPSLAEIEKQQTFHIISLPLVLLLTTRSCFPFSPPLYFLLFLLWPSWGANEP